MSFSKRFSSLRRAFASVATVVAFATPATVAVADIVTFQQGFNGYSGTQDTEISVGDPDSAFGGGFGTVSTDGEELASGAISPTSQILIRFDNVFGNGLGQIPLGSIINSASIRVITQSRSEDQINVHRVLGDWSQSSLTWNSANFNGNTEAGLQADGLDALGSPTYSFTPATTNLPSPNGLPYELDVTSDFQLFSNGTSNFGFAFLNTGTDGFDFVTSEAGTLDAQGNPIFPTGRASLASNRPILSVNFTAVPEPSSMLLVGLAATGLTVYRRKKTAK